MIFPLNPSFSSGIFQQATFDYQYRRVYLSGTMTLIFAAQPCLCSISRLSRIFAVFWSSLAPGRFPPAKCLAAGDVSVMRFGK